MSAGAGAGEVAAGARAGRAATVAIIVLGLLLIPLSRLPQQLGGQTFPDGDESVLALMAKHLSEGRPIPVFTYGQSYGLAWVEAGAAAVAFRLFGLSNAALKGAMLVLWSVGWLFFTLAARNLGGTRAAGIAGALLIASPAWAGLSLKAWGGNISAFLFIGIFLWLVARAVRAPGLRGAATAGIGASLGFVLLSQPIYLPAALPFLALLDFKRRRKAPLLAFGAGLVAVVVPAVVLAHREGSTYWTPAIFAGADPLAALARLPQRFWGQLTGATWMTGLIPSGPFTRLAAGLWLAAFLGVAALALAAPRRRQPLSPLAACVVAVLFALGATLVLSHDAFMYRYLQPAVEPLVLGVALAAAELGAGPARWRRALAAAVAAGLLVTGSLSLVEFRRVSLAGFAPRGGQPPAEAVNQLVSALTRDGVRYVYTTDPMLQWTIMWASREEILARWIDPRDRVPEIPAAVDRALAAGERVALVAWAEQARPMAGALIEGGSAEGRPRLVAGTFCVVFHPSASLLRRAGFRLNG